MAWFRKIGKKKFATMDGQYIIVYLAVDEKGVQDLESIYCEIAELLKTIERLLDNDCDILSVNQVM